MTSELQVGAILDNTPGSAKLVGPCRTLGLIPAVNRVLLIALPGKGKDKLKQTTDYVPGPFSCKLSDVKDSIEQLRLHVLQTDKSATPMPDATRLAAARDDRERKKLQKRFDRRDARWSVIKPLLFDEHGGPMRSALELLDDPLFAKNVRARAEAAGVTHVTVYSLLHRFWAGGSQRSALMPAFDQCGSPGVTKVQNVKLGRRTRLVTALVRELEEAKELAMSGETIESSSKATTPSGQGCASPLPGYVLDRGKGPEAEKAPDSDKMKLAWGWRLIRHGVSREKAYRLTMAVFWAAKHTLLPDGTKKATLLPQVERPTRAQFARWGRKLNGNRSVAETMLGARKWKQRTGTRGGSVQDLVQNVLQIDVFDGTTTDVYLVSIRSRLKKLPPMTRLVLKDLRTGLIRGWYCGWLPPSPRTALLAILCAARSKVAMYKRFGIDITEEQFPSGLARTVQADNGEFKGAAMLEAEEQFGFSVDFTEVFRGDRKGSIESQHHTDHKKLDADAPGYSNGGKHRDRGEDHAAISACWNYWEYMRELLLHYLDYNHEEVPDLAPLDMLHEQPPIKPTRLNIFNWLREHGNTSELPVDVASLEAFCLEDIPAVIRKNGVYLKVKIDGRDVVMPRLRYTSEELIATGLMSEVQRTNHVIQTFVKMDPEDLQTVWLPTRHAGMLRLTCATREATLLRKYTLNECMSLAQDLALARDLNVDAHDQENLDRDLRREVQTRVAKMELSAEVRARGKKPTKISAHTNLRQHAREEEGLLIELAPGERGRGDPGGRGSKQPVFVATPPVKDAAALAMETANVGEN